MPSPIALPLRVLIKGSSNTLWTSMASGPRSDMVFARVMEQGLLRAGRSSVVRNTGEFAWLTRRLYATWAEDIAQWSPDVVILAPGHDTLHILVPRWLERGANTLPRRPGPIRTFFHRKVMRLIARVFLLLQRAIDRPGIKLKRRIRRMIGDIDSYVTLTQQVASPLILLVEFNPPTLAKIEWFGGWPNRIDALNEGMRRIASERANVQFVEVMDLTAQFDPGTPEHLWADGIHFSPEFHRVVGERLAAIAEEWAMTQPHLASP